MNKFLLTITFVLIQLNCFILAQSFESYVKTPFVRINQGLLKGFTEESLNGNRIYSFKGIPYAEPPVGNLRFKDPVPSKSFDGIFDATKDHQVCMQYNMFDFSLTNKSHLTPLGQEDCLVLNVHTPKIDSKARVSVMVFIHGGAFVSGCAKPYTPSILLNKNIVLVVIQYRLGVFGFLSSEDAVMPGNMGLKDQQLALKWVQKNIIKFGGDPDKVTIFGESAGGASVHLHMLSPGSRGLFRRAIMQSGTSFCPWSYNNNHKTFAIEAGNYFNCSFNQGTENYLKCMQIVDASALLLFSGNTVKWGVAPLYILPRVDGKFLPESQNILMDQGKYEKVDVLAGLNKDEGGFVMIMYSKNSSMMQNLNNNFKEYGPYSLIMQDEPNGVERATIAYRYYLERNNITISQDDYETIMKLYSDRYFGICHDTIANILAKDDDVTLFLYTLDHVAQVSMIDHFQLPRNNWVSHADDLLYMFNGKPYFSKPFVTENDLRVRDIILNGWTNFAEFGNPNWPGSNFTWDEATSDNFRHLSLLPEPIMVDDQYSKIRQFWATL